MKRILLLFVLLSACMSEATTEAQQSDKEIKMNNYLALFEIPATDLNRAVSFYEGILDLKIEKMEMPGMEIGVFPYENQATTGVIMKGEGYSPSADGVCIYLNGGKDLQIILDKVEQYGGSILVPKSPHADGNGFFALFLDSEGNKIGLNSEA